MLEKILGFYRHFKGKPYRVRGMARHSETLEELVLYEALYPNELGRVWVRPKAMFEEAVNKEGVTRPRFQRIQFDVRTDIDPLDPRLQVLIHRIFPKPHPVPFSERLKATSQHLCLVAVEGEKIVGFKLGHAALPEEARASAVSSSEAYYSWLGGVDPEYRGLGIASLLMHEMTSWCRGQGFRYLLTKTTNQHPDMIRLNVRHEFEVVAVLPEPNGELKILMKLDLLKGR